MKTLFQCEICETVYQTKEAANVCETLNPLPPCPVKIGDTVHIITRYDGVETDEVVGLMVVPSGFPSVLQDWERNHGAEGARLFLERMNSPGLQDGHMHSHAVEVKTAWQIGKDSFSDLIDENCCIELGAPAPA